MPSHVPGIFTRQPVELFLTHAVPLTEAKAPLSTVGAFPSNRMFVILPQPLNASFPMLVTPLPIVTLVRPLHHANALRPMPVTLSGIVTRVSRTQPRNASPLMPRAPVKSKWPESEPVLPIAQPPRERPWNRSGPGDMQASGCPNAKREPRSGRKRPSVHIRTWGLALRDDLSAGGRLRGLHSLTLISPAKTERRADYGLHTDAQRTGRPLSQSRCRSGVGS